MNKIRANDLNRILKYNYLQEIERNFYVADKSAIFNFFLYQYYPNPEKVTGNYKYVIISENEVSNFEKIKEVRVINNTLKYLAVFPSLLISDELKTLIKDKKVFTLNKISDHDRSNKMKKDLNTVYGHDFNINSDLYISDTGIWSEDTMNSFKQIFKKTLELINDDKLLKFFTGNSYSKSLDYAYCINNFSTLENIIKDFDLELWETLEKLASITYTFSNMLVIPHLALKENIKAEYCFINEKQTFRNKSHSRSVNLQKNSESNFDLMDDNAFRVIKAGVLSNAFISSKYNVSDYEAYNSFLGSKSVLTDLENEFDDFCKNQGNEFWVKYKTFNFLKEPKGKMKLGEITSSDDVIPLLKEIINSIETRKEDILEGYIKSCYLEK